MEPVKPLSAEARREVEAFASKIAGGMGAEIQGELAGHVEDKVRGYLTGEERITEQDAVLLARHHFGRAEVVRSLLEEVQADKNGTVMRRPLWSRVRNVIAGMALASIVQSIAMYLYGLACTKLAFDAVHPNITSVGEALCFLFFDLCVFLVAPCVLCWWLYREEMAVEATPGRWRENRTLMAALVGMVVMVLFRQMVFVPLAGHGFLPVAGAPVYWFNIAAAVISTVIPNLTGPIVVWWLMRQGTGMRRVTAYAGIWIAGLTVVSVLSTSVALVAVGAPRQGVFWSMLAMRFGETVVAGVVLIAFYAVGAKLMRRVRVARG